MLSGLIFMSQEDDQLEKCKFFQLQFALLKPDLKLTKISHYDSKNCEPQEVLEVLLNTRRF